MKSIRTASMPVAAAVFLSLLLGAVTPALAQDRTGISFELFGGWHMPQEETYEDDRTFGLRGGYRLSDSFGVEASLSAFQVDFEGLGGKIDFFFVDTSYKWYLGSGGRSELVLFGGPGWAVVRVDAESGPGAAGLGDMITAHAGVAGELGVGRFYFRPDVRARWLEGTQDIDLETSLAVGLRF